MDPEQKSVADEFDTYNENYSQTVDNSLGAIPLKVDFFTRVKADYLLDILSENFADINQISVLDVGCGIGNFHPFLSGKIGSLDGIDVSEACVVEARKRHPGVTYNVYDGGELPYRDGSFDAAFTICVMHHVPVSAWEQFTQEIYRVLKPGGIAIVFEHNPGNPLTMRVVNRCPFDRDAVLLKSKKTEGLLSDAGFQQILSKSIISIPPANKLLRRMDLLFSFAGLGAQYFTLGKKKSI